MGKFCRWTLVILLLSGAVHADTYGFNWVVSPTFLLANCQGSTTGTAFCSTGDGKIYTSPAAATPSWTCIAGCAIAGGVKTVAGIAPDATGNVPLTAHTTVTAPTFTFTGTGALTMNAPSATTTIP
jgi:hypothetical protein